MRPRSATVIGAGPAGLVAAIHLRRAGLDVTVLEAKARPGGRAASDVVDGFILNQGPHALYLGGPARRELGALGIALPGRVPVAAASAVTVDADGRVRRSPLAGAIARMLPRGLRTKPAAVAGITAAEWVGDDPAGLALARILTYTERLDRLSADALLGQIRAGAPGVRYLHGGWQALVDRLAAAAGDVVRCGVPVRALRSDGGRWVAATDDGEIASDVVVLAGGGPQRAARLLGLDVPVGGPQAVAGVLDLGLERLPRPLRRFGTSLAEPRYLSVHGPPARLAERGVLVGVASYGRASREQLEAFAEAVQPGWREQALMTRHLPSMTTVTAIPTPEHGGLAGRPGPAVAGAPGVFVAGDWVGPHGMLLDAAVSSAVAAAQAAVAAPAPEPVAA